MKKRIPVLCLFLLLAILILSPAAAAGAPDHAAQALSEIDLFRGTDTGFDLDRAPTRREAAVMLVRLYGAEKDALSRFEAGQISHPFADANDWSAPYIAWLYSNDLTRGMTETSFGGSRPCSAKDYMVFLLRVLGYRDNVDFTYEQAEEFARTAGFYDPRFYGGEFLRGDMAIMTYFALGAQKKDADDSLLEQLCRIGAIQEEAAQTLLAEWNSEERVTFGEDGICLSETLWKNETEKNVVIRVDNGSDSLPRGQRTVELGSLLVPSEPGRLVPDHAALTQLLQEMEQEYERTNVPYVFDSYVKGSTPISFLRYNYALDSELILKKLMQMLWMQEEGLIDAPLYCYDWNRNRFDLSRTHIEVDIDNQQLTFVKDGAVIVTTPVVTGAIGYRQTPLGLYTAHSRETNCTLTGVDYSVFVKYWIGVIDERIGLHDASWRSAFGGDNYVYNGSHGCVNIPEAAMVQLFQTVELGTPVLIHGQYP